MGFVRLNYLYRDYGNYKKYNSVVFSNPNKFSIGEIETELRKFLLDDTWFIHTQWNLPDMHFEKIDWEQDHPYHEFVSIEMEHGVIEIATSTIDEFFIRISNRK